MFEKNRIFLSKEMISILEKTKDEKVDFKTSRDNKFLIPFYKGITFHSIYKPLEEGNRYTGENDKLIIAIGFGAGYHLLELAKKGANILVIPVDYILLKAVLKEIDLTRYFNKNFLTFITLNELNEKFDLTKYSEYKIIIHPLIERIYSKETLEIVKSVKRILNNSITEVNTYKKFGKLWLKNIIKNLVFISENREKIDTSPIIIDKKVILVTGAGPSLEEQIDFIKDIRENIFIASADTSLKILTNHSIIPDAVFTFDAQHYSYYHFIDKNNIRLFFDLTSSIRFLNRATPLLSSYPLLIKLKERINLPIISTRTRNIGGAIIDFFTNYFPDHPIVTIGIDYGIKKYKVYSKGTYIDDYRLINSNYLKTIDFYDATNFYKNRLTKRDNWATTALLECYANDMLKSEKIYTLSDSPFLNLKKIESKDKFLSLNKELKCNRLYFNLPDIKKEELLKLLIDLITNEPYLISTYFFGSNENNIDIRKICDYIRLFF